VSPVYPFGTKYFEIKIIDIALKNQSNLHYLCDL